MKDKIQALVDKHAAYSLHGKPDRRPSLADEIHAIRYQIAREVWMEYVKYTQTTLHRIKSWEVWLDQGGER